MKRSFRRKHLNDERMDMNHDTFVTLASIVFGTVLVGGVLWVSLRSAAKKHKHPVQKRITARRDNDRNVPPDTF